MIREGKDRILSALSHLGIELPTQKILVSLNPGNIPKEGSHFDLPILTAILKAIGVLFSKEQKSFYWGELGLDGSIRPLPDILAHLLFSSRFYPGELISAGRNSDLEFIAPYLPARLTINTHVAQLLTEKNHSSMGESTTQAITNSAIINQWRSQKIEASRWNLLKGSSEQFLFWCLVALGRHHILLEGSHGVGKSSWCFAANELQLPLDAHLWSDRFKNRPNVSANIIELSHLFRPPYEAPHHGSSSAAIVGGGSGSVCIGAITRAHRGILFLDEFSEFGTTVLESLREPLENKTITIARSGVTQTLSANIQLLAAMNPCRCGNYRSVNTRCVCTSTQFYAHQTKVSGPLRDRFHLISWWDYRPEQRPKEYSLENVRDRLAEAALGSPPVLNNISLPTFLNPRRQQKWIEFFSSWCRWLGISNPSSQDVSSFNNFLTQLENSDDSA
jgi:magnesium chelatase family protein